MASGFWKFFKGIRLNPESSSSANSKGDLEVDSSSGKLKYHNGTTLSPAVTEDHSATLKNKTLEDSSTVIADSADATKQIKLDAAGTTGTSTTLLGSQTSNRILTLPDATDTLVGKATTDTLTNKTLTAPVISTISNTGTLTLPTATDTLVGRGTTDTLSNKSLIDASTAIVDSVDNTKQIALDAGGTTGTKTTIQAAQTANRVLTLPDATDTLIGRATTDTLTNKTLTSPVISSISNSGTLTLPTGPETLVGRATTDTLTNKTFGDAPTLAQIATPSSPAASKNKLYFKSDDKLYKLNSGGTEVEVGSGGAGGINYIQQNGGNPDAESGVTGWAAYADAAGAQPVDGTGGAPTVTITRTTSSPLRGVGSFLLTKDAANRQGEGVSYLFTIDRADLAKPLNVTFDYEIGSGTYSGGSDSTDSDVTVYLIQDPLGTPSVIQPSGYKITGAVVGTQYKQVSCQFQTASNVTQYRLVLHVATTSASAYTLKFDNVSVGPQATTLGAPITDWQNYTPTVSWTATNKNGRWRRIGDSIEVEIDIFGSLSASGNINASLPTGLAFDTNKIDYVNTNSIIGIGTAGKAGVGDTTGHVLPVSSNLVGIYGYNQGAAWNATNPFAFGSNDSVRLRFSAPIAGWGSSVVVSNDTDTRIVALNVKGDAASATAGNPIIFPTTVYDTHNGYSAGRYTAPVPGFYRIFGYVSTAAVNTIIRIYVNGIQGSDIGVTHANDSGTFNGTVKVNAGDIIDIRPSASCDCDATSNMYIERLSGPSQVAASEKVAARAYLSSAVGVGTSPAKITWDSTTKDSHGALSSGRFTAPTAGTYIFGGSATFTATAAANATTIYLYKNGSSIRTLTFNSGNNGGAGSCYFFQDDAIAGDYYEVWMNSSVGNIILGSASIAGGSSFDIYKI